MACIRRPRAGCRRHPVDARGGKRAGPRSPGRAGAASAEGDPTKKACYCSSIREQPFAISFEQHARTGPEHSSRLLQLTCARNVRSVDLLLGGRPTKSSFGYCPNASGNYAPECQNKPSK